MLCYKASSQADFTIVNGATHCREEKIELVNTLSSGEYIWDFCSGDMVTTPEINELGVLSAASRPFGYTVVRDGDNWFGFMTSSDGSNKFTRLDFGDDLNRLPIQTVELNNPLSPSNILEFPEDVEVINVEGNWYALIANPFATNKGVVLVDFGSNLENTSPTQTNLGDFGLSGNIRGLSVAYDGVNIVLAIANQSTGITLINFRDSFYNSISTSDIISTGGLMGASTIFSVDIIKKPNNWYAFAASLDNVNVLDFGATLFQSPVEDRNYFFDDLAGVSFDVDAINERDSTYVIISDAQDNSTVPVLIDFGRLEDSNTPYQLPISLPSLSDLSLVYNEGRYELSGIDLNNRNLTHAYFSAECGESLESFNQFQPPSLTYSKVGDYTITLQEIVSGTFRSSITRRIEITSNIAPSITYSYTPSSCLSTPLTFTPSTPGLTSYSWDFNGDGIEDSNLENPTFDFSSLGAGTYTVRVDVNDGTCDNFYEEQITLYDPPPAPSYTYNASRLCVNADIDFTNATNDVTYAGPLVYTWEFIDDVTGTVEGTSNVKDPIFAFPTSGNKTVRLTSSIPGCEEISEQTIVIDAGPTANFNAPVVCLGENMTFTNTSVNGTTYEWDFGDGFTATNENPSHLFTAPGNYSVTLRAIDAQGCDDTEVIEVAVSDIPQVSFDFDVPCTSSSGISFLDLSSIENADLIGWSWRVDGVEVSTEQNPTLSFTEGGVKNIALVAYSSNGCEATYNEDVNILTSPSPDFNATIACQGEVSTFEDITFSEGNTIVSWLWEMDGRVYTSQNVNHVFNAPGFYNITLEVTGQNLCSETITRAIEVLTLPTVDFSVQGDCDNVLLTIEDQSTDSNDPILSRNWLLNGTNVGNGSQLFLENLNEGTYDLSLEVTTTAGCIVSSTQSLVINPSPTSGFTFNRAYGLPGDQLTFTNNSQGASAYQWLVDGAVISTSSTTQNIIFDEPGTYQVSLVSENTLGCSDTLSQEVIIAIPEVDLRIGGFDFVQEDAVGRIFLEIENNSNLPVEITEAQVELENQFSVTETITQYIGIGETQLVGLNVGIPLALTQPSYFCVTLSSQYADYPDINPIDNEKCITLQPQVAVEDPFPNPVQGQFRMKVVVPEVTTATITLLNAAGKSQSQTSFTTIEGLNSFFVDMSTKDPGIYFIILEVMGQTFERKIIKI